MVATASPSLPPKSAAQLLVRRRRVRRDTTVGHGRRDRPAGAAGVARGRRHLHLADGAAGRLAHGAGLVRRRRQGSDRPGRQPRRDRSRAQRSRRVALDQRQEHRAARPAARDGHRRMHRRHRLPARPSRSPRSRPRRRRWPPIDPTTKVTVDGTASVAGRSAYELVLAPRDTRSLVGDVRIAVDSKTSVPLRVQVHAAGATGRPAFETTFTSRELRQAVRERVPVLATAGRQGHHVAHPVWDRRRYQGRSSFGGAGVGAEGHRQGLDRSASSCRGCRLPFGANGSRAGAPPRPASSCRRSSAR